MSVNEDFLKIISSDGYKSKFVHAKSKRICICCGKRTGKFSDSYTRLEYSISALCQDCQDRVFKPNA